MKRFSKRKTISKPLLITAIAGVVVVGGFAVIYFGHLGPFKNLSHTSSSQSANYNPPTDQEKSTGQAIKQNSTNQNDSDGTDVPLNPTPIAGSDKSSVVMSITALNTDTNAVYIRTIIETVTTDGSCTLSMSGPNGKSYTDIVSLQAGPSSSTCKGFNVPVSSLSSGTWTVRVSYAGGKLVGEATREVTIP